MFVKQITVSSAINKITSKDDLFCGDYTIDPYQNCDFGCIYCDSSYDDTVFVKTNVVEILEKELKKIPKGRIIVGSVHDPYQKSEKEYQLTRRILETIQKHKFSCHVLTKSDLILRDVDLLKKIEDSYVTISLTSINEKTSSFFEKNVPSPERRFKIVKELNKQKICSGIAIMPLLPFITEIELKQFFEFAKKHNACYVLQKHLELKGNQKNIFFNSLRKSFPEHIEEYEKIYKDSYQPDPEYIEKMNDLISNLSSEYSTKTRI